MDITSDAREPAWLLLVFTLPAKKASERVRFWRRLQRVGSIPFRNAGSMLPNTSENRERFEWLASSIRESSGEASVLYVQSVDDLPAAKIQDLFRAARSSEYALLLKDIEKVKPTGTRDTAQILKLRRRFEEIALIDFFRSHLRGTIEDALANLENTRQKPSESTRKKLSKTDYQNQRWITRPRPGIDRVASAWLISRFIDPKADFVFGEKPSTQPKAVPFDMFGDSGFGHQGGRCTFETLCLAFQLKDTKVMLIGQAVHDADLEDDKFGPPEGQVLNRILQAWERQNLSNEELLRRGMQLIEGLYNSI